MSRRVDTALLSRIHAVDTVGRYLLSLCVDVTVDVTVDMARVVKLGRHGTCWVTAWFDTLDR